MHTQVHTDTERKREKETAARDGREERHISKDCWRVRARVHAFLEVPIS